MEELLPEPGYRPAQVLLIDPLLKIGGSLGADDHVIVCARGQPEFYAAFEVWMYFSD